MLYISLVYININVCSKRLQHRLATIYYILPRKNINQTELVECSLEVLSKKIVGDDKSLWPM